MHLVLVAVVVMVLGTLLYGDKRALKRLGIIGGVCVASLAAFVALALH